MTFTNKELVKAKIDLLKDAIKFIKEGEEQFLCIALMRGSMRKMQKFGGSHPISDLYNQADDELREYIRDVLEGEVTLDSWLRAHPTINYYSIDAQKARVDWAAWMIKCLKEVK